MPQFLGFRSGSPSSARSLREGPVSQSAFWPIACSACRALIHLHSRGEELTCVKPVSGNRASLVSVGERRRTLQRQGPGHSGLRRRALQARKAAKHTGRVSKERSMSAPSEGLGLGKVLEGEEYVCKGRLGMDHRGPMVQQPQVLRNSPQGTHLKFIQ